MLRRTRAAHRPVLPWCNRFLHTAMDKKKRFVEVFELEDIRFHAKNGSRLGAETRHILTCSAIWPRTGFAVRSYAHELTCKEQRTYGAADWADAILMKETLQAPTALRLRLTVPLEPAALRDFWKSFAKVAAREGSDIVEDLVPGVAGALLAAPVDFLGTWFQDREDDILGEATVLLNDADLSEGRTFEIPILRHQRRARRHHPPPHVPRRIADEHLQKGFFSK